MAAAWVACTKRASRLLGASAHWVSAPNQFFLRRARTHFWASELATIRRFRGIGIVGREGFLGICLIIRTDIPSGIGLSIRAIELAFIQVRLSVRLRTLL